MNRIPRPIRRITQAHALVTAARRNHVIHRHTLGSVIRQRLTSLLICQLSDFQIPELSDSKKLLSLAFSLLSFPYLCILFITKNLRFMSHEIQFILYNLPDEDGKVQAVIKGETIWCTQKAMAQLFGVQVPAISKHLKNIFDEGELKESATISKMETVVNRGFRGEVMESVEFYNLDAIISVGYRVNSAKATHFRIWATKILNEYIRKGFVLDDKRLKQGNATFGVDYFRELLERVRSIRASERRIWQQITDIYSECCIDYNKDDPETQEFYAMIQNRFHFAITGNTAAEIIFNKADHTKENMGLTTWKNSPDGRILKSDVTIAKNYLEEKEIRQLERAVSGYFDYIEDLIERENTFNMKQFSASINEFLAFRRYKILPDKGSISAIQAKIKAEQEYDIFNRTQIINSDFDKQIKKLLE